MFHKRLLPYPTLQAFDRPDLLVSCANRQNTIVAPQALAILNDSAVRQYACDFADRLLTEVQSSRMDQVEIGQPGVGHQESDPLAAKFESKSLGTFFAPISDLRSMIERSFQIALARAPNDTELESAIDFLIQQTTQRQSRTQAANTALRDALTDYCQVLFGLNEFIYID